MSKHPTNLVTVIEHSDVELAFLAIMHEAEKPLTIREITDRLRQRLGYLPDGRMSAEDQVYSAYAAGLVRYADHDFSRFVYQPEPPGLLRRLFHKAA